MNKHRIAKRITALSIALSGLLLASVTYSYNQVQRNSASEYPSTPFRLETTKWSEPYSGPLGYPQGAQRASLGTDSRTGGETYYARFPAGSRFELHWHSHAEYAVVLSGKVTHVIGKERYALQAGDYVVIPPKVAHGWEVDASADAFLLIRRDGPADFNFVKR